MWRCNSTNLALLLEALLEMGPMGKQKDLNNLDTFQKVTARQIRSSPKLCAVVSLWKDNRVTDACGQQRLARVVWSHRAEISEKVNAGPERKVSEHTDHRSYRLVRMSMMTPVLSVVLQWTYMSIRTGPWSDGSRCTRINYGKKASLWILGFLQTKYNPSLKYYSWMVEASFRRVKQPGCCTAKTVQEWFEECNNQFKVLTWSPNSPDLSPVQHLWDVLAKKVWSAEASCQDFCKHLVARQHGTPSKVHTLTGWSCYRQVLIMLTQPA